MKKLLFLVCIVALATLGLAASASSGAKMRYVPFLDQRYPVSVLNQKVHTTDSGFKDYGAAGKTGARTVFGVDGTGVEICVVDTGVDPAHEQLDNGKVVAFTDFVNGHTAAYDDNGHGTHVSSIAAGDGRGGPDAKFYAGVAPGAALSVAKVLDSLGRGTAEQVISGIAWCTQRDADVISMSLGGFGRNAAMEDAVRVAVEAGVTVAISAGNSGPGLDTISTPGIAPEAITVGASSEWSGGAREERSFGPYVAWFSSRGQWATRTDNLKPDVVAPGVTVKAAKVGTVADYWTLSGTSMAAPYVAGTIALMLEADPSLTPAQIKDALRSTAFDAGPDGFDPDWGFGLINSYSVVAQVFGQPGRNVFPPHYFYIRIHRTDDSFGSYRSEVVTIGNGSAAFGPQFPPTRAGQPMSFFIRCYTEGVDLDAILVDMTNPGPSSEYPWSVVTASLPSANPRSVEEFGVLPPTVGQFPDVRGYRLFVGPSMPFDDRATNYTFGVDIFYG